MHDEIKKEDERTTVEGPRGPAHPLSDEVIVALVLAGDQELYGELVGRYQTRLFRYAKTILHDGDDAADAVQDAFVKAFRNLESFDVNRRFSSWIYRIVHNTARTIIIKRKFLFFISPEEWAIKEETISDGNASLEAQFWSEEMGTSMKRYVEKLPRLYREPLVLFYLEEKTYIEIGEILEMPVGTVGTRINRAKKMIHEMFVNSGGKIPKNRP